MSDKRLPSTQLVQVPTAYRSGLWGRVLRFGRTARGFRWRPEPRFPGSVVGGRQLLAGNFRFEGALVDAPETSPWALEPPTEAFAEALHGFTWLDDLAALPAGEGRETARAWTLDWIRRHGTRRKRGQGGAGCEVWSPDLSGRRQIRLITHALFLLNGMTRSDSRAFHKALGRHAAYLEANWSHATPGLPRFEALAGRVYSACALLGREATIGPALSAFCQACARDIDEAGGIPSRNPEHLLEVFILLSWAAQLLRDVEIDTPPPITGAMQRIAPTLRALRHMDGGLVRAHGGGRGSTGRLVAALVQSGVRPTPPQTRAMGFVRLEQSRVSVIADAAPPLLGPAATLAHAGTLGFEMTSGDEPVIVACGSGARFAPEWRIVGRATESHSTLSLEGCASSRFGPAESASERPALLEGPTSVMSEIRDAGSEFGVTMSHDGWRRSHGLTHLRNLTLEDAGTLLRGEDALAAFSTADRRQLDAARGQLPADTGLRFAVRFHLHPDTRAALDLGGTAVSLSLASGETWVFRHSGGATLSIKPSLYFEAGRLRPRATKQIVLSARLTGYGTVLGWSFARPVAFLPPGRAALARMT